VAKRLVSTLYQQARLRQTPAAVAAFERWQASVGLLYDEGVTRLEESLTRHDVGGRMKDTLSEGYGLLGAQVQLRPFLFAVQTYFVLVVKLLAAEAASGSFLSTLARGRVDRVHAALTRFEAGAVFKEAGITWRDHHEQPGPFTWYLEGLDRELAAGLSDLAQTLVANRWTYGPTGDHSRWAPADLLKDLYQSLVPRRIRAVLGEFYTPDWLAELILDEAGYAGDPSVRLLDPACGSGTFLLQALRRVAGKGSAARHGSRGEPRSEKAQRLMQALDSIAGFDVNPVAVEAARANVVLTLAPILGALSGPVRLPVRCCDAVLGPLTLSPPRFDLVVGNPPWIRWGSLTRQYRTATQPLWHEYGLFSLKGLESILGSGEKDFSFLFTYCCADRYLKPGGCLAFLITMEALRGKGAGEGFRRFQLGRAGDPLRVLGVHDLVALAPFAGISNKTALLLLTRGARTVYPVPFIRWEVDASQGRKRRISPDLSLVQVRRRTRRVHGHARPLGIAEPVGDRSAGLGPWLVSEGPIPELRARAGTIKTVVRPRRIEGRGAYRAYRGASTEPYGVYWIAISSVSSRRSQRQSGGDRRHGPLIVGNLPERGKRVVPKVNDVEIEADLVYPAVRGAEIKRWRAAPQRHIVMPQDPEIREAYPEAWLQATCPKTYQYLQRFKAVLSSRGSRVVRALAQKSAFYAMYGIGPYTMTRHKVVWQRFATDMQAAVVGPADHPDLGRKPVIPTDTTAMVPARSPSEAHYLCGVLNAPATRRFIRSFSAAGRGFGAPSILRQVRVPAFDRGSSLHQRIAALSRQAHRAAALGQATDFPVLERRLDRAVCRLFR
jgi:SAM-dependent methyltransferase